MLRLSAILFLAVSTLVVDAHADEPAPTAYRGQLILADGLAVGTVGAAAAAGAWLYDPVDFHLPLMVGAFGFTSYVTTAPVIHFAHGNVGRGFLSLGARILLPAIAAATLTVGMDLEEREPGHDTAMAAGFTIGAVGAIALDWFVLTPSAAPRSERPAPVVTPTLSASAEHVFLGVGGSL